MNTINFKRLHDFFDVNLLQEAKIAVVGVGGSSSMVADLVRSSVQNFFLVDPDTVDDVNLATQGYYAEDIGGYKVDALARQLQKINPKVSIRSIASKYEDISESALLDLWSCDLVLMMTDSFECQSKGNIDSIRFSKPTIFAAAYLSMDAVEVTWNFPGLTTHCHRCVTLSRYEARAKGFQNPPEAGSHILAGRHLNSLISHLAVSMIHKRNGSSKPIAEIITHFGANNFVLSKLSPSYGLSNGVFEDATPFTTKAWAPDSPEGFICPDCGATHSSRAMEVL